MNEHRPLLKYEAESAMDVAHNSHQGDFKRVLCVCSAGILRSPTAALVLSLKPYSFNTRCCGLEYYALIPLTAVLLEWAQEIVCMTEDQKRILRKKTTKPIVNLNIPDCFDYREDELVALIKQNYPTSERHVEANIEPSAVEKRSAGG